MLIHRQQDSINLRKKLLHRGFMLLVRIKYFLKHKWKFYYYLEKTKILSNSKKGKIAFVFANGPSLKKIDPHKLFDYKNKNNADLICLNNYMLSDMSHVLIPDYMVITDPSYFGHVPYLTKEDELLEKRNIDKINDLNVPVFIPIDFSSLNIFNKEYWVNNNCYRSSSNVSNITSPMGYSPMTAYRALSVALYMNYEKIYICGFDNSNFLSFQVNSDNLILQNDTHFYGTRAEGRALPKSVVRNTADFFLDYSIMFEDLYKFSNFNIVNLDENSFVDAFSKKHTLDLYR
jgi:hypothetical protein